MALEIRHSSSASAPESIDDLREMLGSLEAQLVSLYEEKEHAPHRATGGAPDEALMALYEDKQRLSARTIAELRESVASLSAQLEEFYQAREHGNGSAESNEALTETLASFTAQLNVLYEEREQSAFTANLDAPGHADLLASLQSFEAQLHALYDERANAPYSHHEAIDMVHSLEAQVAALLEERNELADQLSRTSDDVTTAKRRARELVNAVLDQSFA